MRQNSIASSNYGNTPLDYEDRAKNIMQIYGCFESSQRILNRGGKFPLLSYFWIRIPQNR